MMNGVCRVGLLICLVLIMKLCMVIISLVRWFILVCVIRFCEVGYFE